MHPPDQTFLLTPATRKENHHYQTTPQRTGLPNQHEAFRGRTKCAVSSFPELFLPSWSFLSPCAWSVFLIIVMEFVSTYSLKVSLCFLSIGRNKKLVLLQTSEVIYYQSQSDQRRADSLSFSKQWFPLRLKWYSILSFWQKWLGPSLSQWGSQA